MGVTSGSLVFRIALLSPLEFQLAEPPWPGNGSIDIREGELDRFCRDCENLE